MLMHLLFTLGSVGVLFSPSTDATRLLNARRDELSSPLRGEAADGEMESSPSGSKVKDLANHVFNMFGFGDEGKVTTREGESLPAGGREERDQPQEEGERDRTRRGGDEQQSTLGAHQNLPPKESQYTPSVTTSNKVRDVVDELKRKITVLQQSLNQQGTDGDIEIAPQKAQQPEEEQQSSKPAAAPTGGAKKMPVADELSPSDQTDVILEEAVKRVQEDLATKDPATKTDAEVVFRKVLQEALDRGRDVLVALRGRAQTKVDEVYALGNQRAAEIIKAADTKAREKLEMAEKRSDEIIQNAKDQANTVKETLATSLANLSME